MLEENKPLVPLPDVNELITSSNSLTEQIIKETDPAKLEDLTKLFLMSQKKKNIARMNKLSTLLEFVDDEALMRFQSAPESFDNDQLLKYMNATQQNLTAVENSITQAPTIQITNNEVNINTVEFDRDARKRIMDAIAELTKPKNIIEYGEEDEERS